MQLKNTDNLPIVDSFIRLFGEAANGAAPHFDKEIEFRKLSKEENDYSDIMGRVGRTVYISMEEAGKIGLTDSELLASIAHEVGHIVYNTRSWQIDCEERADAYAAELGLGRQMISTIEKIADSRRYPRLTSHLVRRIHFLQNACRPEGMQPSRREVC